MGALAIVAVAQWHLACPDIPGDLALAIGEPPGSHWKSSIWMEERCTTSKWCGSKLQPWKPWTGHV